LPSISVHFLIKHLSSIRHSDIQDEQILDFPQKSDKDWVKVDFQETLFNDIRVFPDKEVLVQFFFSGLFYALLPLLDFLVFKFSKVLAEGRIELLNIFILFTVLDGLGEN